MDDKERYTVKKAVNFQDGDEATLAIHGKIKVIQTGSNSELCFICSDYPCTHNIKVNTNGIHNTTMEKIIFHGSIDVGKYELMPKRKVKRYMNLWTELDGMTRNKFSQHHSLDEAQIEYGKCRIGRNYIAVGQEVEVDEI